jgi:asparagine synthase (glutamine-hydrolysing)
VGEEIEPELAAERVRDVLADSLRRHLVADVGVCSLLSGGLDSAVLTALAVDEAGPLATYCSGASEVRGGDLEFARRLAHELGTDHTEVPVDAAGFEAGWTELIEHLGQPLSTPNEVAIHALSRRLRDDGHVVALSGEGADELFGGYEEALAVAARFEGSAPDFLSGGRFQLESSAWISPAVKGQVLSEDIWQALEEDAFVVQEYERGFQRCRAEAGERAVPLDAHLRFQRRINLAGLLQRLDAATMLSGVEGRTPFADTSVVELAESLPMALKFDADAALAPRASDAAGTAVSTMAASGKLVLRRAFADRLPVEILERPKASFPLPFREWIVAEGSRLGRSPFAAAFFRGPLLKRVSADPGACWNYAWPMMNLARWGDRWWG